MINLELPILLYIKLIKDDLKRKELINTILSRRHCSIASMRLKSELNRNEETLSQIRLYCKTYLNQTKSNLSKLKESDSKAVLLKISNNLTD